MGKGRLEAFSDGVLAIIITIMVLELRPPHGDDLKVLTPLIPKFLSYVLSFIFVGIYWNNHHHMLHAVRRVNGRILWANMHLLFWLSLIPFATAWMGENNFSAWPVAIYGIVLFCAAIAYFVLSQILVAYNGRDSALARALGSDFKGKVSLVFYILAIPLSFVAPLAACLCYTVVAIMWLIPDRRIERVVDESV